MIVLTAFFHALSDVINGLLFGRSRAFRGDDVLLQRHVDSSILFEVSYFFVVNVSVFALFFFAVVVDVAVVCVFLLRLRHIISEYMK